MTENKLTEKDVEMLVRADEIGIEIYKTQKSTNVSKLNGEMIEGCLDTDSNLVEDQSLYDYEETIDVDDYATFEVNFDDLNDDILFQKDDLTQQEMLDSVASLLKQYDEKHQNQLERTYKMREKYVCMITDEEYVMTNAKSLLEQYYQIVRYTYTDNANQLDENDICNFALLQAFLSGKFNLYDEPMALASKYMEKFEKNDNATFRDLFENILVPPMGAGFATTLANNVNTTLANSEYEKQALKFLESYKYNEKLDDFFVAKDNPHSPNNGYMFKLKPLIVDHGFAGVIDLIRQYELAMYSKIKTNLVDPYAVLSSLNTIRFETAFDNIVSPYAPDPNDPAFKAHENDKTIPLDHLTLNDTMTIKRVKALLDGVEKYIDIYQLDN